MRLFDSLSGRKKTVAAKDEIRMYTCGPTVYDYAHIGNLRAYLAEDIIKRIIGREFKVKHVMNITDVGHLTSDADTGEDKMELGAKREKKNAWDIAEFYTKAFIDDINRLKIKPPDILCKASNNISEMIALVSKLEEKGYTYKTDDGIYFDTSKFKNYGKLARLKKEGLKAGKRVALGGKKNITDFALWKLSLGEKRQMEWESPWGKGFPGWHIECSAMSMKYLGTPDIHAGGIDHIPVHHTNEIAQSEAATGKKFAKIWIHVAFMLSAGKKISKSMGNYYTLNQLQEKGFSPMAFRYLCASSHYRSEMNFTFESLKDAENAIDNINDFYRRMKGLAGNEKDYDDKKLDDLANAFWNSLKDDANTPGALAFLFEAMHMINKDADLIGKRTADKAVKFLEDADSVFCFLIEEQGITDDEKALVEERERLRKARKYEEADKVRQALNKLGITVEDTSSGTRWKKH